MAPHWDRSTTPPTLKYRYTNMGQGGTLEFTQDQIWHVSAMNLENFGLEGSPTILLAKESLSVLMACEETAGRSFANGLGMGGFISFPDMDNAPDEKEAQNIVDRLRKDFSGSQNAGKFSLIPGGGHWEKMTWSPLDSQLLESRKWNEQEIVRLLGGAPLLVKMGLGEQNSTYASSSAFLDEYFNTSLLPYTTAIEQSITRDLIPKKKWGRTYAKHNADVILRGSPKERAETTAVLINSWQMTPNEGRAIEDRDSIDGGDFLCGPSNGAIYDPVKKEFFIPGQLVPATDTEDPADAATPGDSTEDKAPPVKPTKAPNKRLKALAESMADRVIRKEAKGKVDAKFVSEVLNVSVEEAEEYVTKRKDRTDERAREVLIMLAMGDQDE
jgi:HK97 family phage portal protein